MKLAAVAPGISVEPRYHCQVGLMVSVEPSAALVSASFSVAVTCTPTCGCSVESMIEPGSSTFVTVTVTGRSTIWTVSVSDAPAEATTVTVYSLSEFVNQPEPRSWV